MRPRPLFLSGALHLMLLVSAFVLFRGSPPQPFLISALDTISETNHPDIRANVRHHARNILPEPDIGKGGGIDPPVTVAPSSSSAEVETYSRRIATLNRAPEYPRTARERLEEGTVRLRAIVNEARLESLAIERSSGSAELDRACLETVRKWTFPPLPAGHQLTLLMPFRFSLTEEND